MLGPLAVRDGATPVRLGGRRQRALLARPLLDANRTVAVDRLVDDLWGHDVPDSAVKMVHIYVSQLRKLLPQRMLVTRSPGYAVELEPEALDVVRFSRLRGEGRAELAEGDPATAAVRLREALALWRGAALAEFPEAFARAEGAHLEELHLACLEDRIDADLALGRHADLVEALGDEALHELRKRVKDLWYASQILRPAAPKKTKKLAARAHKLSDVIGADHDLAVLQQTAGRHRDHLSDAERSALAELIERRRGRLQRRALRRADRLYRRTPRAAIARIGLSA